MELLPGSCLTQNQHSLIVGSLLGDGAMRCKKNALLEINHSLAQKTYVDWKFRLLEDLVTTPPRERKSNGGRIAYRFTTLSLPQLTPYYHAFYRERHKVIPKITLSPLALAVWFMDDGHKSYNTVYLNTQQFGLEDQIRLISVLADQWGLRSTLNRDRKYRRIRLATTSVADFEAAIAPYVLPELRYKLPGASNRGHFSSLRN
jgi:hypothetical protein